QVRDRRAVAPYGREPHASRDRDGRAVAALAQERLGATERAGRDQLGRRSLEDLARLQRVGQATRQPAERLQVPDAGVGGVEVGGSVLGKGARGVPRGNGGGGTGGASSRSPGRRRRRSASLDGGRDARGTRLALDGQRLTGYLGYGPD